MAEIWTIPREILRQSSDSWSLGYRAIQGGAGATGFVPLAEASGGGIWTTNADAIHLRTPDHVLYWRSLDNYCEGGANPVIVPLCDGRHFPAPLDGDGERITQADIPHDDDTPHDDDAGYYQPLVDAAASGSAALNAVQMLIGVDVGGELKSGMFFSIEHAVWNWRLYQIRTAVIDPDTGLWNVEFRPRLREAVANGTRVEFDMPRCLMRLQTPDALKLTIERRRFAAPSWAFIECGKVET